MKQRTEHPAVNHLAKFIDEEFIVIKGGRVQISAFLKAYEWWCEGRSVVHRRFTPVELLDRVREDFGIEPGKIRFAVDGQERFAYGLPGIRFKNDPSLNWRLRYRATPRESPGPSYEVEPGEGPSEQEKRRAYYIANREKIIARKRERKGK